MICPVEGGGSHYCLAGSVEWGDHCWKTDTGSWKRVSGSEGITDVEGRVLRDKVVIVLGLVLVEGWWAGVGGVTLVEQALWDVWRPSFRGWSCGCLKWSDGSNNCLFRSDCLIQTSYGLVSCWWPCMGPSCHQIHPCFWTRAPDVYIIKGFLDLWLSRPSHRWLFHKIPSKVPFSIFILRKVTHPS